MATVYVLYSATLDKYYIGSCDHLEKRLQQHQKGVFPGSFTTKSHDWELYYYLNDLTYGEARKIESHIKKMKSKKYIENLKKFPEIVQKLIALYSETLSPKR